jgi:predicted outer membrane repeat protein
MNTIKIVLTVPLFCLLALPGAAAATYSVATTGSDTNPGTAAEPFKTIQHGIDAAADGDTIQVAAGTYYEHIVWNTKSLALHGAGTGQSIIDGAGAGACLQLKNLLSTAPIQLIQGFTIQNGNDPGTQLFSERTGGGLFIQFGSPVVNNCIFTGNQGGGIYIFESSPTLDHCIVAGNQGGGIFSVDGSPIVNNCLFTGNSAFEGGAIAFYGELAEFGHPVVSNCTFTGNTSPCAGGAIYSTGSDPTVNNCIVWANLTTDTACSGLQIYQGGGTLTVNFSDIGDPYGYEGMLVYASYRFPGTGNIKADPLFLNPSLSDYRLSPGSPCINAGNASIPNLPAIDLNGAPRIIGSAPDMGAYEAKSGSWPPGIWFVDGGLGKDNGNPGTPTAPFRTVTKALQAAASGDHICIKPGNFGNDRPRITKPVVLINWLDSGAARIGMNNIRSITVSRQGNPWFFDDPAIGLFGQAFAAQPDVIFNVQTALMMDTLAASIPNTVGAFRLFFSDVPFPGYTVQLFFGRANIQPGLNAYGWRSTSPVLSGVCWLELPFFKYFENPPQELYFRADKL